MIQKALLVALEGAFGRRFRLAVQRAAGIGDIGGLQRRLQILVNDLKGFGIGVVDADLLRGQRMFDDLDLNALIR